MGENTEQYSEKELNEGMTEVKTGRRIIDTDKYGLVQIRFPKVDENRLADWEYSKVFQEAVMDGIPTNKEMERLINERKLWTEQDDHEIEAIKQEIEKQFVVLSKMNSEKRLKEVEASIGELRNKIHAKQQERQRYFNNTAESKADEAKISFLIYKCTEKAESEEPVWDSYDEFKNEEDQKTVNVIVHQFLTFINGLPADFLSKPSAEKGSKKVGKNNTKKSKTTKKS
ncbi:hypothetical protein [Chengkuizengella axinellae]|uniref:Tail assembly chaperone n=1 Tax=Chengkuizengella axinellae TaxID=3064388 RepID=A0ABT9IXX6_9BACL|nr:hypothetical protein [Chengkuizengella sp. 2205SS18-9]MDP5273659.1 hypothetical protein [Chengkuizengella sp. 2205SS18-9]